MKIHVLPKSLAKEFKCDEPWVAISIATIVDDWPELPTTKRVDLLQIYFPDLDTPDDLFDKSMLFNEMHARQILDFVKMHKDKTFLIHCEAGRSRSPAVAAAISKLVMNDDMIWFKNYTPNRWVYRVIMTYANSIDWKIDQIAQKAE